MRNVYVQQRALAYIAHHGHLAISSMTWYEVIRGYRESNATTQLQRFDIFCQHAFIMPLTESVLDRAADLWVAARRGGHPHGDADLLIAASALAGGRSLVTGNTAHFAWISGLKIEDWRQP